MARRLVRRPRHIRSQFKPGQHVRIEGDAGGDIYGVVVETHRGLTRTLNAYTDEVATRPGVTVRALWWGGVSVAHSENMLVEAWDTETERSALPAQLAD